MISRDGAVRIGASASILPLLLYRAKLAVWLVVGCSSAGIFLLVGCANPDNKKTSYPSGHETQCMDAHEWGRNAYVKTYGQPYSEVGWKVTLKRGENWGRGQWMIMMGGQRTGGYTSGNRTVIGCGPNEEISQNDLRHEAYEKWCQTNGKKAHK